MAETTISAFDARRKFGKVLDRVAVTGDNVIVERHGEPVAAVVPIAAYRQWQEQIEQARATFFERARKAAERADMDPDEAEVLVAKAIAEVRAERRARAEQTAFGA